MFKNLTLSLKKPKFIYATHSKLNRPISLTELSKRGNSIKHQHFPVANSQADKSKTLLFKLWN